MYPFEWLACVYFLLIAAAAHWAPVARRRRAGVQTAAAGLSAAVAGVAYAGGATTRQWLPHLYLVLGYWLPALLVPMPTLATAFERWLLRSDASIRDLLPRVPPLLAPVLELAYLVCYPLIPVSFVVVWLAGGDADVGRFWTAVLLAGYASYVSLPWLVSRPPRLAENPVRAGASRGRRVASLNAMVLARVSHRLNTFPSGHVAVSVAAAGIVWTTSPAAGLLVALMAAAIAVGAAAGRYHYVVDVVLGIVVGAIAIGIALSIGWS